jgi:hypothetical protein
LAISANPDQTVALGCQDACTDSAIGLAVIAKRNRTRAITATGTVTPSASPSGVGVGDPVPVSMAETTTGTVTVPTAKVGVADPTPDSRTQTASGSFPEPPPATVIVGPIAPPLAGDQFDIVKIGPGLALKAFDHCILAAWVSGGARRALCRHASCNYPSTN